MLTSSLVGYSKKGAWSFNLCNEGFRLVLSRYGAALVESAGANILVKRESQRAQQLEATAVLINDLTGPVHSAGILTYPVVSLVSTTEFEQCLPATLMCLRWSSLFVTRISVDWLAIFFHSGC